MNPSTMKYRYTTKNFHRYEAVRPDATIREVYIPRIQMADPVAEISVIPTVSDATIVPLQSKPAK